MRVAALLLSALTLAGCVHTDRSHADAQQAAQEWVNLAAFSRPQLVRQLTAGDGYTHADATYAVAHIDVDWRQEARQAADAYLHDGHTPNELAALLIGDRYTRTQANYGADTAAGE